MLSAAAGVDGAATTASDTWSLLGSYLAGRVARGQHDTDAAATYYREALVRDPGNDVLIEQSFLMELMEGHWPRTEQLARELAELQPPRRMAQAFMGLVDFKAKRYAEADERFKASGANPVGELTSTLARAWLYQAQDKTQEALALLDAPKQPEWAQYYLRFHRALLADQAGRRAEARAAYDRIPKNDQRTLRVALAYARHAASAGDAKLALSVLKANADRTKNDGHPVARVLLEQIEAGERPELLINTPAEGMAEFDKTGRSSWTSDLAEIQVGRQVLARVERLDLDARIREAARIIGPDDRRHAEIGRRVLVLDGHVLRLRR